MVSQVAKFAGLSDRDRKKVSPLPRLAEGDRLELRVRRRDGKDLTVALPRAATSVVEALLARLLSGERVAILTEDQELSPTEAFIREGRRWRLHEQLINWTATDDTYAEMMSRYFSLRRRWQSFR
jgi:hypothetical protein